MEDDAKKPWLIVRSDNYLVNFIQKYYDYTLKVKLKSIKVDEKLFSYVNPVLDPLFISVD